MNLVAHFAQLTHLPGAPFLAPAGHTLPGLGLTLLVLGILLVVASLVVHRRLA